MTGTYYVDAGGFGGFTGTYTVNVAVVAANDLNADGHSDLLWRHSTGVNAAWDMNGSTIKSAFNVQTVDASYKLAGTGDFDGNGISDLLWRNTTGVNALWK